MHLIITEQNKIKKMSKQQKLSFLSTKRGKIINERNKEVLLRGVNLGGWLMMEGYILGGRNIPEHIFKREFIKKLGREELERFEQSFRANFIKKEDIKNLKKMRINCLRLPFNFRLIKQQGLKHFDRLISWCREYKIYVILDMHAAPGAQNTDWHSDSQSKALFWERRQYQKQSLSFWTFIASRYKDESIIAGYDVINEPVIKNVSCLKKFYKEAIKTIRKIDKKHIIFLEGNLWAQDIDFLNKSDNENIVYSIHFYQPLNFTFNFQPNLVYPGKINGQHWSKKKIHSYLKPYYEKAKKWKTAIYVGEFGINYRCGCYGELEYLRDVLTVFKEFNFHWSYWTYKAVYNSVYPDGIYQYFENPPWINREGIMQGWECFSSLWKKRKGEIISSWRTENFKENNKIISLLKESLKKYSTSRNE